MLGRMGKRDSDLETDAELWARVARSARPLKKGTAGPATPKPRVKRVVADVPPVAKPAPRPLPKPTPAPRGDRLDRQTLWNLGPPRLRYEEAAIDVAGDAADDFAALESLSRAIQSRRTTAERMLASARGRTRPTCRSSC